MTDTLARLKSGKLTFETMVDQEAAMNLKKGNGSVADAIRDVAVYTDQKKGMRAGAPELMLTFGTTDLNVIVERIIKKGEIEVTKEYRDEALENRKKQVVDFLSKNALDVRTNRPFTPEMITNALKQGGVKIENQPVDRQIKRILDELKKIIPIKIETKKIKVVVPVEHTGKVYGLIQEYKEKEDWMSNGNLEVTLNIPVGMLMEFYDKLNSITHGSALTSEVKE